MLTYEEFEPIVNALTENNDELDKIAETLRWENVFDISLAGEVTDLLAYIFNDDGGWIECWAYEMDYGRDWYPGCAQYANGKDIDLSSTRKLYDFLVNNMGEGEAK